MFSKDFTCPSLLVNVNNKLNFEYEAFTHYGQASQPVLLSSQLIQH